MCQQLIKRQEATCQDAPRTRGNTHQGRGDSGTSKSLPALPVVCAGAQWHRVEPERRATETERERGKERERDREAGRDTLTALLW